MAWSAPAIVYVTVHAPTRFRRIIVNKTDLVSEAELATLKGEIRAINSVAPTQDTVRSVVDLDFVLNLGAFALSNDKVMQQIEEDKVTGVTHLDTSVRTITLEAEGSVVLEALDAWLGTVLWEHEIPAPPTQDKGTEACSIAAGECDHDHDHGAHDHGHGHDDDAPSAPIDVFRMKAVISVVGEGRRTYKGCACMVIPTHPPTHPPHESCHHPPSESPPTDTTGPTLAPARVGPVRRRALSTFDVAGGRSSLAPPSTLSARAAPLTAPNLN